MNDDDLTEGKTILADYISLFSLHLKRVPREAILCCEGGNQHE